MNSRRDIAPVVAEIVAAYADLGSLNFGYGQGSVFSGFSADSDLDLVLIWDRDDLPSAQERPAHALCDADFAPRQNDGPAYALDNLMVGGWAVDVASYTRACFEGWFAAVESSGGWRPNAWPLPLHAVAGFIYGQPLADPHGTGETIRTTRRVPPNSLATGALDCLGRDLPVYAADLASAARRDDAWLFHALASPLIKNAYVAWFASEGYYLPFPKHLNRWVERFGLDQRQLQLEKEIWSAPTLTRRRDAIIRFAENVLGT